MEGQMSIFDILQRETPCLRLTKKVRLIETFSGIGAQAKAFENLERDGLLPHGFEKYKTSDWEYNAVLSYRAVHFQNDTTDYSVGMSKDEVAGKLFEKTISSDGNKPLTLEQIKRIPEEKMRNIYNAFIATHNMGSIVNVHAKDLEIVDKDKYTYLLTYSFPCTDISNAGAARGMGEGTRSGLLWEIQRIFLECVSTNSVFERNKYLPDLLLLENVPPLVGKKFRPEFEKWCEFLESIGYTNAWTILNAKNYGIPQNRDRVFMWSWLGDAKYEFPKPFELDIRLKDVLEDHVDEKYYLSEKAVEGLTRQLDFNTPPLS